MPEIKIPSPRRSVTATQKFTAMGVAAAAGVASLALSLTPDSTQNTTHTRSASQSASPAILPAGVAEQEADLGRQLLNAEKRAAAQTAEESAATKALSQQTKKADEAQKGAEKAETKADESRTNQAASRSTERSQPTTYADNLDGWIREALAIMETNGIPGTYEGIHRNVMRESSGDPNAINNWDINAQNGAPSIGLLQVIKPTFDAYHVNGTKQDQYDPVANIVAACNYAADKYGSMDNVDSAY